MVATECAMSALQQRLPRWGAHTGLETEAIIQSAQSQEGSWQDVCCPRCRTCSSTETAEVRSSDIIGNKGQDTKRLVKIMGLLLAHLVVLDHGNCLSQQQSLQTAQKDVFDPSDPGLLLAVEGR